MPRIKKLKTPKQGTFGWILEATIKLIPDEEKWTKEVFARDVSDKEVGVFEETACKFCLRGAIMHAAFNLSQSKEFALYVDYYTNDKYFGLICWNHERGIEPLHEFNDRATYDQIVKFFDNRMACVGHWEVSSEYTGDRYINQSWKPKKLNP